MKEITEDGASEKKFLLPGGQRFYFKVSDLVGAINKYKDIEDNSPKPVSIEYGVHSVDSLSGSTGQGRGVNGMYFAENRFTKLDNISQSLDEMQSTDLICFDTFALGQGHSGAKDNVPHNIYNAGFKITIGNTKPICLKSFVVKDKDGSYSLGLYYIGDGENYGWEKNASDSEFAFPIYWDQDEAKRTISSDDLSKAKANLQIIDNKGLEISEAKIKESQAIVQCHATDNKSDGLFYFAESDKYLYKEEDIPTDKDNNKKSGPTSWLKFVGKFVPIPVLIFLLVFFVIKVAIAYAIIYTVLSIIAESLIYYIFFHKNCKNNDKGNNVEKIVTASGEEKESMREKIQKSVELKEKVEKLPWKYGTVKFDGFSDSSSEYKGSHTMIFRYKQDENENSRIVCIQYCIYSVDSIDKNKLETCRVYTEEFPDPEITIELNVVEDLYLKVDSALTFCNKDGNPLDENILQHLNATINLDDKSQDLKGTMDKAAKNKITNRLIKG